MNDAKFSYNFFANKNTTDVNNSISALPEGLPKKNFTAPNAAVYDSDKKNTTVQSDNEKIVDEIQNNHNRIRSLIKLAVIGAAITILIIISTIAWFTMNRETETNGLTMSSTGIPFEIATTGGTIRNQGKMTELKPAYHDGESNTINTVNYYTSANTDSLLLRFNAPVDDPATPDVNEGLIPDIGPGSQGELNLYIIPKQNGDLNAYIDIDLIGFKSITTESATQTIEITDSLTTASGLTNEEISECQEAVRYLSGHILFFEGLSNSPTTYSYVKPVTGSRIHFTQQNAVAGTAYKVPIYWTWSNTLGQIALKTNTNDLRDGIPVVQETTNMGTTENPTEKALLLSYLKENKETVFKGIDVYSNLTDAEKTVYDTFTDAQKVQYNNSKIDSWIDNADTEIYFDILSEGYNTADFCIGSSLNYFLIELSVSDK